MNEHPRKPITPETTISAEEAETRFPELPARAEKGESFTVTRDGRAVARIVQAPKEFDREKAKAAGQSILARLDAAGPRVSEEQAQQNWEELKADMERGLDERMDRWSKS